MIVLDASAALDLLLRSQGVEAIERALEGAALHAPQLLDLEVVHVLRRRTLGGFLDAERALEAIDDLAHLPVVRYPHEPFLLRVFALRENLTAFDAAYVALAEALGATLLTRDARLAAAPGHSARIALV